MKNILKHKKNICEITAKLYDIECLHEEHTNAMLFAYLKESEIIIDAEEKEQIETFIKECNRQDISLPIVQKLFDEVFSEEEEDTSDDTFDNYFNDGRHVPPMGIFDELNRFFNVK